MSEPEFIESHISLDDEIEELRSQRHAEYVAEAMRGAGQFWSGPDRWDNEQEFMLYAVIGVMLRLRNLTDAERWCGLMAAVAEEVKRYADGRTRR